MSATEILQTRASDKYHVDENGCWIWLRALDADGYAVFSRLENGKHTSCRAMRLFYEIYIRKIDSGKVLDHLCRVRKCVNPYHLQPVSIAVNTRRGASARLTAVNISDIFQMFKSGEYTKQQIADIYGVHRSTISLLLNGKTWV